MILNVFIRLTNYSYFSFYVCTYFSLLMHLYVVLTILLWYYDNCCLTYGAWKCDMRLVWSHKEDFFGDWHTIDHILYNLQSHISTFDLCYWLCCLLIKIGPIMQNVMKTTLISFLYNWWTRLFKVFL